MLFIFLIVLSNYLLKRSRVLPLLCEGFVLCGEVVGEVVEKLVLVLVIRVHEAVTLVHHVLLAPAGIFEHSVAEKA